MVDLIIIYIVIETKAKNCDKVGFKNRVYEKN
jgi:hypothetical protein